MRPQNGLDTYPFQYTHSVGFGIAYPLQMGMREPYKRDER